jgi:glutamate racemase
MNNNPIGIFDSGVGGLSVWKELIKVLPNESMIYFADSDNCPYGHKSQDEIIALSKRIVDFFVAKKVKLIVVACNTATAAAINYLRKNYNIPFVGMEPAVKPAALRTQKGKIGILATEGTLGGRLFIETSEKWANDINVEIHVGEGFVELVEKADFNSVESKQIVSKIIQPFLDKDIDQLVLACTHYPFLCDSIKEITKNKQIEIINPAPAVARQTRNLLIENKLISEIRNKPDYIFYSTGSLQTLNLLVKKINPKIKAKVLRKQLNNKQEG